MLPPSFRFYLQVTDGSWQSLPFCGIATIYAHVNHRHWKERERESVCNGKLVRMNTHTQKKTSMTKESTAHVREGLWVWTLTKNEHGWTKLLKRKTQKTQFGDLCWSLKCRFSLFTSKIFTFLIVKAYLLVPRSMLQRLLANWRFSFVKK